VGRVLYEPSLNRSSLVKRAGSLNTDIPLILKCEICLRRIGLFSISVYISIVYCTVEVIRPISVSRCNCIIPELNSLCYFLL